MDKKAEVSGKLPSRDAVLGAFRDQLLESGYDGMRVVDLVERSGVARSTFYEHFEGREDVLRDSMRDVLLPLSRLGTSAEDLKSAEFVVEHFRSVGATAFQILTEHASLVRALLAQHIDGSPVTAAAIAGAQLALVCDWLEGRLPCTAMELCVHLRDSALRLQRG